MEHDLNARLINTSGTTCNGSCYRLEKMTFAHCEQRSFIPRVVRTQLEKKWFHHSDETTFTPRMVQDLTTGSLKKPLSEPFGKYVVRALPSA